MFWNVLGKPLQQMQLLWYSSIHIVHARISNLPIVVSKVENPIDHSPMQRKGLLFDRRLPGRFLPMYREIQCLEGLDFCKLFQHYPTANKIFKVSVMRYAIQEVLVQISIQNKIAVTLP